MAAYGHNLNLPGVLSETKRIINAHSRHFLALSVFFLLPFSFSLIIYPTLQAALSQSNSIPFLYRKSLYFISYASEDPPAPPSRAETLFPILFSLLLLLFSLLATASITYSTFHGFYGRPVKLISSIKSILFSFLPLLSTMVVSSILLALMGLVFGYFAGFVYRVCGYFGVEIEPGSKLFLGFVIFFTVLLVLCSIYLQVEWSLANVIVVVESQWGFSPLNRSSYLIKGMKLASLCLILLFGMLIGFLSLSCSKMVQTAGGVSGWMSWAFILQTVVYSGFMTILMLYYVAANTVLYMYCKALHGELAFEIAEEFAREYVTLPFDDGKVPHVVYIAPH